MHTNIPGDVLFGWHLGFEDPALVRSKEGILNSLHTKMGRQDPVPQHEGFWDSWMVTGVNNDLLFLMPVLWKDLDHFKYLASMNRPEGVSPLPVVSQSLSEFHFAALLGLGVWRVAEELDVSPAKQRQVNTHIAKRFAKEIFGMACGKPEQKWLHIYKAHNGKRVWLGQDDIFSPIRLGAKLHTLSEANIAIEFEDDWRMACLELPRT